MDETPREFSSPGRKFNNAPPERTVMQTKTVKPLDNSDICVDALGNVGIIGGFSGGGVEFFAFDPGGNTSISQIVAAETLTRARLDQIPPNRRAVLADIQWAELGHE